MSFFAVLGLGLLVAFLGAVGSGTNAVAAVAAVLFFPAAIALYFAPAINASMSKHPSSTAIAVLNTLLGWTVLGWVGALVWSYGSVAMPAPAEPSANSDVERWREAAREREGTAQRQASETRDADLRDCPFCAEPIKRAAVKCKHCGSAVEPAI